MSIKRVSHFQCTDGKLFDREHDAKVHENKVTAIKELTELLEASIKTGRPDAVVRHIVEEATAIRDILLRYSKRTPRTPEMKTPEMSLAKVA